jgi:hypothetical protein
MKDTIAIIFAVLVVISLLTLIGCGYAAIWVTGDILSGIVGKVAASAFITAIISSFGVLIGTT